MLARIDIRPRRRNAGRPAEKSAPGFLQWLRGRACAVPNCRSFHKMEAAHVSSGGDVGMGTKASDRFAIPLCGGPEGHHAEQHRIGVKTFEARYRLDLLAVANAYWRAWPSRGHWERAR